MGDYIKKPTPGLSASEVATKLKYEGLSNIATWNQNHKPYCVEKYEKGRVVHEQI